MRIISGRYKGHKLFTPAGLSIRPTSDRVRETLFSVLGAEIVDARFLDLFAGSGAVGIEALSRGARIAVFIDDSPQALQTLRRNLIKVGAEALVYRMTAQIFLQRQASRMEPFDIIFCDPPYRFERSLELFRRIVDGHWLQKEGCLVYESSARVLPSELPSGLVCRRQQTVGETRLSYYQMEFGR
ncbi:16S rRNA (guanine(966)-N(2))-methyltransferase RsmD [candidate division KSB1 bacterium]|nr:16S rRNA (guanine(966)-N(2))-methyltransferase RsmD [candidate division KSB1 bacterium]